jgi:hypothetical protein
MSPLQDFQARQLRCRGLSHLCPGMDLTMSNNDGGTYGGPVRSLRYNLELLANLIYLARRCESEQRQRYLDWAESVIKEVRRDLKLRDGPVTNQAGSV